MNVVFELFGHAALADAIAAQTHAERGRLLLRRFPDAECYLRFESEMDGCDVTLVANLARPDEHIPALLFAASTARELGACKVGLVSPYLPYMRQDRRFHSGEAVTSRTFARLISTHFDWMVTVDPHLHRYASLGELYSVPATALSAAPLIAEWIRAHVEQPLLLGPDAESAQWVSAVAEIIGAPWVVSQKTRHGDRDVEVELPDIARWRGSKAVILDDIIASGRTMIEALRRTREARYDDPICVGIHAVFCDDSYRTLIGAGAGGIVTTDSVPHESNVIRLAALLANAVTALSSPPSSAAG